MKLLTRWQTWWDKGREENKFHCDLLLEPGDSVIITSGEHMEIIAPPPGHHTKVHLAASWEHRKTLFTEEQTADDC